MSKAKSPWFKFYATDWLADSTVMGMTAEERGVYIQLLAIDWNEGGVRSPIESLALICRASPEVVKGVLERSFNDRSTSVQRPINERSTGEFPSVETRSLWVNPKLEKLREDAAAAHAQRVAAGKASAQSRGGQQIMPLNDRSTDAQRPLNESESESESESERSIIPPCPPSGGGKPEKQDKFTPPTEQDVAEHFRTKGLGLDESYEEAALFWHHHDNNHWQLKRGKMKSWKSAVVTWCGTPMFKQRQQQRARGAQRGNGSGFTRNAGTFNDNPETRADFEALDRKPNS